MLAPTRGCLQTRLENATECVFFFYSNTKQWYAALVDRFYILVNSTVRYEKYELQTVDYFNDETVYFKILLGLFKR